MSGDKLAARISAGFFKLGKNVANRRLAKALVGEFSRDQASEQIALTDHLARRTRELGKHLLDQRIGLGMY